MENFKNLGFTTNSRANFDKNTRKVLVISRAVFSTTGSAFSYRSDRPPKKIQIMGTKLTNKTLINFNEANCKQSLKKTMIFVCCVSLRPRQQLG